MVRLKAGVRSGQPSEFERFQFHNGSIKSKQPFRIVPIGTRFNSTMVRLKAEGYSYDLSKHISFQFHNGSIKSAVMIADWLAWLGFQFHNGSIKSHD